MVLWNVVLVIVWKKFFGCNINFKFCYYCCPLDMSFRHIHEGLFMSSWNLEWTNNLLLYGFTAVQGMMFFEKSDLIKQKLDLTGKIVIRTVTFKMNRFLSMFFRHTHCLSYENMLKIHVLEKVSFLQNIPLVLVLDHVNKH